MEAGLRNPKTVLVLNSRDVNYREFSFPFHSKAKVKKAILYEIHAEYPDRDFVIDHFEILPGKAGEKNFLVAFTDRTALRSRIDHARKAGLQIVGITSDVSTLGNFFSEGTEALVMEMDEGRTLFILYHQGLPRLIRDIPMGTRDFTNPSQEIDAGKLRPLTGEIKRTVQSFGVKSDLRIESIYVAGHIVSQKAVLNLLREKLGLDFIAEAPRNTGLGIEASREELLTHASLFGAFEWDGQRRSFNFLKEGVLKSEAVSLGRSSLRWGLTILFFGLVTLILSTWLELSTFERRRDFLTAELKETFKSAFPGTNRVVDEVRQARNFLDVERKKAAGDGASANMTILDALRAISRAIPEGTSFEIASLFWERGKVEIYGKTDSFNAVNVIQEALKGNQNFSDVTISNAKMINEGQDVEFKISIHLAG